MKRGTLHALPLALIFLLVGACARFATPRAASPPPDDRIALSVLADAIYLVRPLTGERTKLVAGLPDFQSGYAAWAPERTRLAYANAGIFLIDARSRVQTEVVGGPLLSMPAWSPDGTSIAYGNGASLWVTPAGPGPLPTQLSVPATLAPLGMDWHARGGIAFEGLHRDCTQSYECPSTDESEIWIMNPDATGLRQITHVGHAEHPRWSPDGTLILFIRRTPGAIAEPRELWIVGADGRAPRRVLGTEGVVAADWSPDGRQIAMARTSPTAGTLQLWIAHADGSNNQPVGSPFPGVEATLDW